MAEFVIEGGTPLRGTLTPSGNKNAAFPLIAAALLTDQPVTLRNLPDISDVRTMLQAMEGLGVAVGRHDRHTVTLRAAALRSTAPDPTLLRRIRGALVLPGPLLARERQVRFGTSGGDQIGRRRIDSHMLGLQALGAVVEETPDLVLRAERLRGADILLDEASVTATENVLAAAVLAEGTTIIRNAASEPHVQDQCRLLVQMGARIDGIGSNVLVVHGGRPLAGADFTLGADFVEVAASSRSPRRPAARSRSGPPASSTCVCRCWCSAGWASRSASGATTSWSRTARRWRSRPISATPSRASTMVRGLPSPPT